MNPNTIFLKEKVNKIIVPVVFEEGCLVVSVVAKRKEKLINRYIFSE